MQIAEIVPRTSDSQSEKSSRSSPVHNAAITEDNDELLIGRIVNKGLHDCNLLLLFIGRFGTFIIVVSPSKKMMIIKPEISIQ